MQAMLFSILMLIHYKFALVSLPDTALCCLDLPFMCKQWSSLGFFCSQAMCGSRATIVSGRGKNRWAESEHAMFKITINFLYYFLRTRNPKEKILILLFRGSCKMKTGAWSHWKTLEGERWQWTAERHRELWNIANTFCHGSTGQRISSVEVTGTLLIQTLSMDCLRTVLGDLNPWRNNLLTPMAGEMWVTEHRANKHLHCALAVATVINSCYCSQILDKLQTRKSQ